MELLKFKFSLANIFLDITKNHKNCGELDGNMNEVFLGGNGKHQLRCKLYFKKRTSRNRKQHCSSRRNNAAPMERLHPGNTWLDTKSVYTAPFEAHPLLTPRSTEANCCHTPYTGWSVQLFFVNGGCILIRCLLPGRTMRKETPLELQFMCRNLG